MKLKNIIQEADRRKIAIGHFNISNIEGLWAVFNASRNLNMPVIAGVSEGERDFLGLKQAVTLVKSLREEYNHPIFINADHTYSLERVKEAIDAGVDAVIFDGAKMSVQENIGLTKQSVSYARMINPDVLVEGELGYIGTSSKMLDEVPEGVSLDDLTTPEEAENFIGQTGANLFAPSVGNIHGMLKHAKNPQLNIERIKEIREAAGVPLVLHGGSGISDQNFRDAIAAGISVVHVSTELRLAYRQAMENSLKANPNELAPYRLMKPVVEAIQEVVEQKLKLFNNLN